MGYEYSEYIFWIAAIVILTFLLEKFFGDS
jgi:hypothetical protein